MQLEEQPILYGETPFKGFKDLDTNQLYFADRIPNRGVLDFGQITSSSRVGLYLAANAINSPVLVKSLHCVSPNNTDDSLTIEVWQGTDYTKVANRISLQYYHKTEMPKIYPELILFPDHTVFITAAQDCRVLVYCEPINISFYANILV